MRKKEIYCAKKTENIYLQEHVLFSEEYLADQAGIVRGDAIKKLFEDRIVAQKLKEALAQ